MGPRNRPWGIRKDKLYTWKISPQSISLNLYKPRMESHYVEEDGVLLLMFATSKGIGKLKLGKTFAYGKVRNLEYEDSDTSIIFLGVQSSCGTRRVQVDEGNLILDPC